jgi:PQQ-dependent dehydrogenase (methanol/ethanol family)
MMRGLKVSLGVGLALAAAGLLAGSALSQGTAANRFGAAQVDDKRQIAADSEPGTWMSAGRTYDEQRYSPLTSINKSNIKDLKLTWYGDLDTERGQESTPVVVDGALYVTSAWSKVFAYNAKTGQPLWKYDPKVDASVGQLACCDVVNRGVAAYKGKIYLGALDGRLIALDGKTGAVVWSVQTTDLKQPYTITQTPRVAHGLVFIGNAGAEYSVRGYVSAYDAETGKLKWRFYTVPSDPKNDKDGQPELKKAASTWSGDWWKFGGGATAWDTIVYDPKTNLVYFGTGNGLSWSRTIRDPKGGDNLFVSSIIAVNADTGKYAWHYQSVPGDEWDYDVTNPLMTADLKIDGKMRHVLMQAPKTGFFYVWDAKTGKLISAEKFGPANWASKIDLKTGRPVENPDVRYSVTKAAILQPAPLGAHNWYPMSYSPRTGYVYIPVTESSTGFQSADPAKFTMRERASNLGTISASPEITALFAQPGALKRGNISSWLEAYDPVAQKVVWKIPNAVYGSSGTMVTASDILFSGNHTGQFAAYDARTGDKLWSAPTQAKVVAAPSTYTIDGEQYVAVLVGARGLPEGVERTNSASANNSRILVFKLGGAASLPTRTIVAATTTSRTLNPPLLTGTNEQVLDGQGVYARTCAVCHGANAVADKTAPDLRFTTLLNSQRDWDDVLIRGSRAANGMASFKNQLADQDSENLRHYIISRANQDKAAEQARR